MFEQAQQLFQRDGQIVTPETPESVKAALASSEIEHKAETKRKGNLQCWNLIKNRILIAGTYLLNLMMSCRKQRYQRLVPFVVSISFVQVKALNLYSGLMVVLDLTI
ncbi:hypothetical protein V6N13_139785 [Hibiscus sabdariffa]